jgi:hypothetical protein
MRRAWSDDYALVGGPEDTGPWRAGDVEPGPGLILRASRASSPTRIYRGSRGARAEAHRVAGLATDNCLKESTLDARRLGFPTTAIEEAIGAVDLRPGDGERAIEAIHGAGGERVTEPGPSVYIVSLAPDPKSISEHSLAVRSTSGGRENCCKRDLSSGSTAGPRNPSNWSSASAVFGSRTRSFYSLVWQGRRCGRESTSTTGRRWGLAGRTPADCSLSSSGTWTSSGCTSPPATTPRQLRTRCSPSSASGSRRLHGNLRRSPAFVPVRESGMAEGRSKAPRHHRCPG